MIYFTADLHFGHKNIIDYCKRPFKDVEEMDRVLIENINKTVQEDDILYIVGDVSFYSVNKTIGLLKQIKCKNLRLVQGNHDSNKLMKRFIKEFDRGFFKDNPAFLHNEVLRYIISHIPIDETDNRRALIESPIYNLHGHLHTVGNGKILKNYHYDVGVDNNNYKPISIQDIMYNIYKYNNNKY